MNNDFRVAQSWATTPSFYRAPSPPAFTPMEYQLAGVEYALARDHCIIGDQPGLGKTCQAIMISNAIKAKKTLVVCPASLRLNWEKEIWKVSTAPRATTYPILKAKDGVSDKADYVIISYDLLRNPNIMAALLDQHWDHVILDEAHALKDPKGNKRTQAICSPDRLPSVTGRFTLLSGTLLPNQPIECYNPVRLLDWNAIDHASLDAFRNKYYAEGGGMVRGPVWDAKLQARVSKVHWSENVRNVPRNLDDLQLRLRQNLMVRRLKSQVLTQLPDKQFHLVPLAITPEMKRAMKHPGWAEATQLYEIDPTAFQGDLPVDGQVSTARRVLGEAKVGPTCDYIEDLLEGGVEKVVVSAFHTSVLKVAKERLSKYGLTYMDGSTSAAAREEAVRRFQKDDSVRVILGQTQVIGEGHTLTAAQDVVLLEPDWVPGRIEQMVDRIHRIGQTGDYVIAHMPVVPNTLDERIIASSVEKAKNIHKALDG